MGASFTDSGGDSYEVRQKRESGLAGGAGAARRGLLKLRTILELSLATLFASAALLTIVSAEWIEELFEWSPDRGNGSLEWLVVAVLGAAAAAVGTRGVKDLRCVHSRFA